MAIEELFKKSLTGLILAAALSAGNCFATKLTLDFEGIGDLAAINDFYNFGADGDSNTGTNYGITFSNAAFGIIDADVDITLYSGNFANEPSGSTALIFREGGDAIMNVEAGFRGVFSFFYSSAAPGLVKIYDGLDGTGNLLASIPLITNFNGNDCTGDLFGDWCHWDQVGARFKGKAKSVVFEVPREFTFYDNFILGGGDDDDDDKDNNNGSPDESPKRDLIRECKNNIAWHKQNRRVGAGDTSLNHAALHSECKQFKWYRKWYRRYKNSLTL